MARTHRPLARWPRLSRRQGWLVGAGIVVLTLLWMVLGSWAFVEWQAGEAREVARIVRDTCDSLARPGPAACALEWSQALARIEAQRPAYWREAIDAALLVVAVFWTLVAGLIAIARWIVTGEAPSA